MGVRQSMDNGYRMAPASHERRRSGGASPARARARRERAHHGPARNGARRLGRCSGRRAPCARRAARRSRVVGRRRAQRDVLLRTRARHGAARTACAHRLSLHGIGRRLHRRDARPAHRLPRLARGQRSAAPQRFSALVVAARQRPLPDPFRIARPRHGGGELSARMGRDPVRGRNRMPRGRRHRACPTSPVLPHGLA